MTIEALKGQIESKVITNDLIIFLNSDTSFISRQYINAISRIKNIPINYVEEPDSLVPVIDDIFFDATTAKNEDVLNVCIVDNLSNIPETVRGVTNAVISANAIDKAVMSDWEEYIVKVPKLENWQIKDYVYSICDGVKRSELDKLITLCGSNIDRLQSELDKVLIFTEPERPYIFDSLLHDGSIDDLTNYNIFNVTKAITHKDLETLTGIYKEIHSVDINEFGLLTILYKNFRNIISVQLTNNPTPETTGLESKQLYAIKKIPRVYSPEQLANIFIFLGDLDRKVKNGELPTEIMIDYIITKILSM